MITDSRRDLTPEELAALNTYSIDFLSNLKDSAGINDSLWEEAIRDMLTASELGISSDEDFKIFFYIDHFAEDVSAEILGTALSEDEQADLKRFMFHHRAEIPFNNLLGFRAAMLKWIKSSKNNKAASRNTRLSPMSFKALSAYNIESWARLVADIDHARSRGINVKSALIEASAKIDDNIERLDFLAWYQFKFGKMKNLYNINKIIKDRSVGSLDMKKAGLSKFAGVYEDALTYYVPKEIFKQDNGGDRGVTTPTNHPKTDSIVNKNLKKEDDEKTLEISRNRMVSRTFALDKLLEKSRPLLDKQQVSEIEDSINSLRKLLRQIKKASIAHDIILRTALVMDNKGFAAGGNVLRKIASQKIEKSADVMTTLSPKSGEEELATLDVLINKLTDVSTFLKQRSIVRDLAEADLMLYDLNIASLFPELTEAQSRLIDAFSYAGNKIDDILPKIRGSAANLRNVEIKLSKVEPKALPPNPPIASDEISVELPDHESLEISEDETGDPLKQQVEPHHSVDAQPPVKARPPSFKPPEVRDLEKAIQEG